MEEGIRTALCPAFTQPSCFLLTFLCCFSLYAFYTIWIDLHVCRGTYIHVSASMRMSFLDSLAYILQPLRTPSSLFGSLEHMLTNPPFLSCDVLTNDSFVRFLCKFKLCIRCYEKRFCARYSPSTVQ